MSRHSDDWTCPKCGAPVGEGFVENRFWSGPDIDDYCPECDTAIEPVLDGDTEGGFFWILEVYDE